MSGHAVLVGATASGKSALAMALARDDSAWELVSADSMQVYRGMDIGTAKPTAGEQAAVPHHLLDRLDPWEDGTLAWFQRDAQRAIADIEARGRRALLVGGTALYVQAVVDGLDIPGQYPAARADLESELDTAALHARLVELDPVAAGRMEPSNRRRVLRALEVTVGSGRPFSSFGPGLDAHPPTAFTLLGVRRHPDDLRARIARRYDQQMAAGFLDEVRRLHADPRGISRTAGQALGYKELVDHLEGRCALDEAVDLAVRRTGRFARRQVAWFRRDPRITWLDATPDMDAADLLGALRAAVCGVETGQTVLMPAILTPDQRVRVFLSSTLEELAPERAAAQRAVEALHLTPVLFELGARPHPPRELYRAYLEQSHVFVAIYWERYGWVAPDMEISGLEDELLLSGDRPKLVYLKRPAPNREPRLEAMLDRVRGSGVSYKAFETPAELEGLLAVDLASLLSERFQEDRGEPGGERPAPLPIATTAFVGRDAEVDDVLARLRRDDVRLVTLVGPGGIGKTRLALEIAGQMADELPHGAVYVPLEAISEAEHVPQAILRALDLHDRSSRPAIDVVRAHLADRRTLLVVDNFEHLLDAAASIADLLASTTDLKVLATSREPLRIRAEHQVLVPSLSDGDAIDLFLDRARAGRSELGVDDLDAVREICEGLDRVPLAIELAAACTRLLGPRELLERMSSRLDLLVAGPRDLPARQRALRSTIAWSYDLLDPEEQEVFAALGVFVGPFTERAAAEVTGRDDVLEVLAALVDKSLLAVVAPDGGLRLRMLGMVREFALERLRATNRLDDCRARHAEHYGSLAREAAMPLRTAEQTRWLDRLEADAANLRAGLDWWIEQRSYDELAEVAWFLWVFAWLRGYSQEIRDLLRSVLDAPDLGGLAGTRLQAAAGILAVHSGGPYGIPMLTEAVERARAEGQDDVLAAASMQLAVAGGDGDMDEALALFRRLGDEWGAAATLCAQAWVHVHLEAIDGAEAVFDEALAAVGQIDDDLVVAMILANVAERAIHDGDAETAAAMVADAVAHYRRLRAAYPASYAVEAAAHLAALRGRPTDAVRLVAAAERMRTSIDVPIWDPARDRHERLIASLRDRLDPVEFDEAWRSVEDLDYPGTIDLVVGTLDLVPGTPEGSP